MGRGAKKGERKVIRVRLGFTIAEAAEVVEEAKKAGFWTKGLKLEIENPHDFPGKRRYRTQKLGKFFLKVVWPYYLKGKEARTKEQEEARRALWEAQERAKKLGVE